MKMGKRHLRDCLFRSDVERDLTTITSTKSSPWFPLIKTEHARARYLTKLSLAVLRIAFTELRFQSMPSVVLDGQYGKVHYEERLCLCGQPCVKDLRHYLLQCLLYMKCIEEIILLEVVASRHSHHS